MEETSKLNNNRTEQVHLGQYGSLQNDTCSRSTHFTRDPEEPSPLAVKPMKDMSWVFVCIFIIFVIVLALFGGSSIFLGVYFNTNNISFTFTSRLYHGYSSGDINGAIYSSVRITVTDNYKNVTVWLVDNPVEMQATEVLCEPSLDTGPPITTTYAETDSKYYANITNINGPVGSGFNFYGKRIDGHENTKVICEYNFTINSTSPKEAFIRCHFNERGIYQLRYYVEDNVTANVSCESVIIQPNITYYNNSEYHSYTLSKNHNTRSIPLKLIKSYQIVADIPNEVLTLQIKCNAQMMYFYISVSLLCAVVIILVIFICCVRYNKCKKEKLDKWVSNCCMKLKHLFYIQNYFC